MMFKRVVSRLTLLVATTFAMGLVASSTAHADDDFTIMGNTVECVSVGGENRGCITHIDNGDDFEVCDQNVDGKSVYGAVQEYSNNKWVTRGYERDGGDPGCDKFHFDVTEGGYDKYRLKVCWNGTCDYDPFRE